MSLKELSHIPKHIFYKKALKTVALSKTYQIFCTDQEVQSLMSLPGADFTKGLKFKTLVLTRSWTKIDLTKGHLAKFKLIIQPQWFSVSCDLFKIYYW